MKSIAIVLLAGGISLLATGCGCSKDNVPTAEMYEAALKKKLNSPGGGNFDIQKRLDEFRAASDDQRKAMYEDVN